MQAAKDNRQASGSEGFTLVEMIVAMTLMAMVFTAAFGSYFLGMRMVEDAREEIRAAQIIQSEVERLRTMNWDQLSDPDLIPSLAQFEPHGSFVNFYAKDYKCFRYNFPLANGKERQVTVVVEWLNSRESWSAMSFTTRITKNGLNDYYYRDI